jgi:acylphosphatase
MSDTMITRLVHYSGRVQGVGFRATARSLARGFAVNGYVKNLSDGRVQLLAEGKAPEVERFLHALRDQWREYLEVEQIEPQRPSGQFRGFEIQR